MKIPTVTWADKPGDYRVSTDKRSASLRIDDFTCLDKVRDLLQI
jgi:hypothetical protein